MSTGGLRLWKYDAEGKGVLLFSSQGLDFRRGLYEASLDYGEDCMGAGACNYGTLVGRMTTVAIPQGTENIPYDPGVAQMVILTRGIQGYFVESQCGASCSDAQAFWVYEDYEYVLGLKSGLKEDVIAQANAAIENSIP